MVFSCRREAADLPAPGMSAASPRRLPEEGLPVGNLRDAGLASWLQVEGGVCGLGHSTIR
jgi:hypothetical protein